MEPKLIGEPKYEKVDLSTEQYKQKLTEAPVYAKKGLVNAEFAEVETPIETVLENGTVETANVAKPGDVIITNPGGERYVIGREKFMSRYEATETNGVYRASGMARALRNDTGAPIEIMAPWGEPQFGDEDCMITTVFNPDKPEEVGSDRYIIGAEEFCSYLWPS